MAEARMHYRSMSTSEKYGGLPFGARLLQRHIIDHADDQGRLRGHPAYLRSITFLYDDVRNEEIQVWLNLLVQNETIILYQSDGRDFIQLLNWWKYQRLTFAKPSEYPAPEGWEDRVCINGKANIPLTYNWNKADGTRAEDTCDATGKPLPFVAERIAAAGGKSKKPKANPAPVPDERGGQSVHPSLHFGVHPREHQSNRTEQNNNKTRTEKEQNNNMRASHEAEPEAETDVVVALKAFGLSGKVAQKLAEGFNREHIEQKIAYLKYLVDHHPKKVESPSGWLRRAIEEDYGPPDGFHHGGAVTGGSKYRPDELAGIILGAVTEEQLRQYEEDRRREDEAA